MKTSQALGHRTEQTARSALLFVLVGAAIVSGVGVAAIRRRSRKAPDQVQNEGRRVGNVMGTGGDAIETPLVGHEFRFRIYGRRHRMHILQSARQTDSGALRGEYFAAPCASVPEHAHRRQEERFEVVSGTLGVRVGGRELSLSPGQNAVGPPGVPHECYCWRILRGGRILARTAGIQPPEAYAMCLHPRSVDPVPEETA
ncbi:MAG: cupin domain-containing protein, partial [Actinomycetota bacterium]|nr:cupin domain-containing protein [Actinomycetota bacterium]